MYINVIISQMLHLLLFDIHLVETTGSLNVHLFYELDNLVQLWQLQDFSFIWKIVISVCIWLINFWDEIELAPAAYPFEGGSSRWLAMQRFNLCSLHSHLPPHYRNPYYKDWLKVVFAEEDHVSNERTTSRSWHASHCRRCYALLTTEACVELSAEVTHKDAQASWFFSQVIRD